MFMVWFNLTEQGALYTYQIFQPCLRNESRFKWLHAAALSWFTITSWKHSITSHWWANNETVI